jgi:hypothetical protein
MIDSSCWRHPNRHADTANWAELNGDIQTTLSVNESPRRHVPVSDAEVFEDEALQVVNSVSRPHGIYTEQTPPDARAKR